MEKFDFHSLLIHLLSPKGATLTEDKTQFGVLVKFH